MLKLDESMLEELVSDTSADNGKLAKMKIPALLGQRNRYLQMGLSSKAATCLKSAAFYAISAAMREYHQMGKEISQEDAITYITAVHEQVNGGMSGWKRSRHRAKESIPQRKSIR